MGDETKTTGKSRRGGFLIGFATAMLLGIAGLVALDIVMEPLSGAGFCASCHEMTAVHESWQQSPHHTNRSGVQVTCVDCHLPPREDHFAHLAAKAWSGAKDGFQHFFGGEYDADAARLRVVQTLPSARCVRCHSNLAAAPASAAVAIVHQAALDRLGSRDYACIACHNSLHGPKPELALQVRDYEEADNSYCYVCHLNFQKEPFVGVHLAAGVSCDRCHGISEPHMDDEEGLTPPETMFPKAKVNGSCMTAECHPQERMEKEIGHRPFFAGVETEREYCTDCHGAHRLDQRHRRWDKDTRKLIWTDGTSVQRSGGGM